MKNLIRITLFITVAAMALALCACGAEKDTDGVSTATGGEAIFVMDQVRDSKNTDENWLQHIAISEAMKHLCEREKHILDLRFFQGKTQMEVADEIGISQAQVSRLEKSALKHMRKYI